MSEDLEMTISFFFLDFQISKEKNRINFIFSGPYKLLGLMDINFTYHHLHVASLSCMSLNLSILVPFLFIFILPPLGLVFHCIP